MLSPNSSRRNITGDYQPKIILRTDIMGQLVHPVKPWQQELHQLNQEIDVADEAGDLELELMLWKKREKLERAHQEQEEQDLEWDFRYRYYPKKSVYTAETLSSFSRGQKSTQEAFNSMNQALKEYIKIMATD